MLDANFINKLVSNIGGGEKGAKQRNKTSLPADKLFSFWAPTIPILLLAFILYFNSVAFQPSSIACEPHVEQDEFYYVSRSKQSNRFYIHEYCWEKAETVIYGENGTAIETQSFWIQKEFPYFCIMMIALISLPSVFWSRGNVNLVTDIDLIVSNLIEALNITVEAIESRIRESIEDEQEEAQEPVKGEEHLFLSFRKLFSSGRTLISNRSTVGQAHIVSPRSSDHEDGIEEEQIQLVEKNNENAFEIFQELKHDIQIERHEEISQKFLVFREILLEKCRSRKYFTSFLSLRLANMTVLCLVNWLLYIFSWQQDIRLINCKVGFATPDGSSFDETVNCSITGVDLRHWLTGTWMIVNTILMFFLFLSTVYDLKSISFSRNLLEMIDQVVDTTSYTKLHPYSDLSLILRLIELNLCDNNPILSMSLKSWQLRKSLIRYETDHSEDYKNKMQFSLGSSEKSKFLTILSSFVAIYMKEDHDAKVDKLLEATEMD